jgi:2,4-dienoyl-CoA reductase-like NADH-dependent reductase (Old Yellow Enzyme family)
MIERKDFPMTDPLFEPGRIGTLNLKNRLVRSATWEGLADEEGAVTPPLIDLYAALARGGAGLLITGHSFVHPAGKHSPGQLGSQADRLIPGLEALTRAVHDPGGTIALQLNFGGAYLSRSRAGRMTAGDMKEVVQAFGRAAGRARRAGFDAVQVLAAHGFLLSQLLCPRYNPRVDDYGGALENRARALLEVMDAIRDEVGPDYPLLVKINSSDLIPDGLQPGEAVTVARWLEKAGVDAIEISGGLLNRPDLLRERARPGDGEAFFEEAAREFRKEIAIPLILVGGLRSYGTARRLIETETVDFVALCRPFIREPDLARRWASGDYRDAACIYCNNCVEGLKQGQGLHCRPLEPREDQTFFVQKTEIIMAGTPFPEGTAYRVSYGLEDWQGNYLPVVRIQMVQGERPLGPEMSLPGTGDGWREMAKSIEKFIISG